MSLPTLTLDFQSYLSPSFPEPTILLSRAATRCRLRENGNSVATHVFEAMTVGRKGGMANKLRALCRV